MVQSMVWTNFSNECQLLFAKLFRNVQTTDLGTYKSLNCHVTLTCLKIEVKIGLLCYPCMWLHIRGTVLRVSTLPMTPQARAVAISGLWESRQFLAQGCLCQKKVTVEILHPS